MKFWKLYCVENLTFVFKHAGQFISNHVLNPKSQGLTLYGLLNAVQQQPRLFEAVFLPSSEFDITLDDLLDSLEITYSQSQSLKEKEEDVFKYYYIRRRCI